MAAAAASGNGSDHGARTPEQLEDNLAAAAGIPLAEEEMDRLTAASDRPAPYPFGLLNRFRRR